MNSDINSIETNTIKTDNKTALFVLLGCSFSLVAFVGGLIVGLVVFGWWLWPVQWVDAAPTDLRHEYQVIYIDMVVDSFEDSLDLTEARYRLAPWNDTTAHQLLTEAFDAAVNEGAIERADAIQILVESFETPSP